MDTYRRLMTRNDRENSLRRLVELQNEPGIQIFALNSCHLAPSHRTALFHALGLLAQRNSVSRRALQLSFILLDTLLAQLEFRRFTLWVVAVVCLVISIKFLEIPEYPLASIMQDAGDSITKEDFLITELFILEQLEWRVNFPTPADFVRELLYIKDSNCDFSRAIENIDEHCVTCYRNSDLAVFSSLEKAVASMIFELGTNTDTSALTQWTDLAQSLTGFDPERVELCKTSLAVLISLINGR